MTVTIQFCGAARTVTGSCYLFQSSNGRLLVDCGLFQGSKTLKALNYGAFPFRPADIDAVLLTHAHVDHSGLLPKLIREGSRGRIMATRGTVDLCSYLLPDAGSIQESEVITLNRRSAARGRAEVSPIYTQADAIASLDAFQPVEYETWFEVIPGVRARYWNAGHILGSASIELEFIGEGTSGQPLRVIVSGDIGPDAKLLQPDPAAPSGFDYVLSESTYGNADRPPTTPEARRRSLAVEVREAYAAKGAMLIPAFAVERTQELIVDLVDLMEHNKIPAAPIFLDSPLAIHATEVFRKHASSLDENIDIDRVLSSLHLRFTETVDESKAIAKVSGFHIIIAASGMCDAGRIRHHLKRWLWHNGATVLLVGFQAQGTLGRFLEDGVKAVRIQGEEIKVAARIRRIGRILRTCRRTRTCALDRGTSSHSQRRIPGPRRGARISGLSHRISERTVPAAQIFRPILDDIYELSTAVPTPIDVTRRRRLAPEAVVALDWHNDMSKLILDINDRIEAAADDRARAVIIRSLRRAIEGQR